MTQTPITPGRYAFDESAVDVVSLGSRTSAGSTSAVRINSRAFLLQSNVTNIGTDVVVRLEGSLDETNFFPLGTNTTYTANGFYALTFLEIPCTWVRANLVSINTGTPTVAFTLGAF
jgi:hypothetical protein